MPPGQRSNKDKVKNTVDTLKNKLGWKSVNEFVESYYNSPDYAPNSLRSQAATKTRQESKYAPREIIAAWRKTAPDQALLNQCITEEATRIMIKESTAAYKDSSLQLTASGANIAYLTTDFGLNKIQETYWALMPCLTFMLMALLTAENDYERKKKRAKIGKEDKATRVAVVIISILLFFRNRATNAFQLVMGIFLSSAGAGRRVIDVFNHMGICVSYQSVQKALKNLSEDAKGQAQTFVLGSRRLWGLVYDNINFTLRKASQRIDSTTQQINATTSAIFSFPKHFATKAFRDALSVAARAKTAGLRHLFSLDQLEILPDTHTHASNAFKHAIRTILLTHMPGRLSKKGRNKVLRKHAKRLKPRIRVLSSEKTKFFPLPALNEEEASVGGTIRVVEKLFTSLLGLAEEAVETQLRILVGDWLTIRNLRLMKMERHDEFRSYLRFDWVQEVSMPFHFQLNALYMIFRTHYGTLAQQNPSSLEHHRNILRRGKVDPKKPEYNKAKELLRHSVIARILDCTRIVTSSGSLDDLRGWNPSTEEFERVVNEVVVRFTRTDAAQDALDMGDEVLAHSILFIRDALFFWEFCEAIRDADVGRMWVVYDFWVFMMRGAGCHNYGNEILEMKAQFTHEFPPKLREVIERSWLVNRWGKKGRSIPTDLYLEHNNGFTKGMFAALGSCASIGYIQTRSSACVEVLRQLSQQCSAWFGTRSFNRRHREVSIKGDIAALLVDLSTQHVHTFTRNRKIYLGASTAASKTKKKSPVRDVLREGMVMLSEGGMFDDWLKRTSSDEVDLYGGTEDDIEGRVEEGFADPNGRMDLDVSLDEDLAAESPFSNVDSLNGEAL